MNGWRDAAAIRHPLLGGNHIGDMSLHPVLRFASALITRLASLAPLAFDTAVARTCTYPSRWLVRSRGLPSPPYTTRGLPALTFVIRGKRYDAFMHKRSVLGRYRRRDHLGGKGPRASIKGRPCLGAEFKKSQRIA